MTIVSTLFSNLIASSFFSFVPAITTVHPDSFNDLAIDIPMPPDPPEISATFPSNSFSLETGCEMGRYAFCSNNFFIFVFMPIVFTPFYRLLMPLDYFANLFLPTTQETIPAQAYVLLF